VREDVCVHDSNGGGERMMGCCAMGPASAMDEVVVGWASRGLCMARGWLVGMAAVRRGAESDGDGDAAAATTCDVSTIAIVRRVDRARRTRAVGADVGNSECGVLVIVIVIVNSFVHSLIRLSTAILEYGECPEPDGDDCV